MLLVLVNDRVIMRCWVIFPLVLFVSVSFHFMGKILKIHCQFLSTAVSYQLHVVMPMNRYQI